MSTVAEITAHPYPRYAQLPRLAPTETGNNAQPYASREAAMAAGWLHIPNQKSVFHYRGYILKCVDVTPGRWFGLNYALRVTHNDLDTRVSLGATGNRDLATSHEVWAVSEGRARYSARFRAADVLDAVEQAKRIIDGLLGGGR